MFVKQRQSLFVFLQGHPEYDANSLLLEYAGTSDVTSGARAITTRKYQRLTSSQIL